MEQVLLDILEAVRQRGDKLDPETVERILRAHNKQAARTNAGRIPGSRRNTGEKSGASARRIPRRYAKKMLLPYYLTVKESDRARWESWGIDTATEKHLMASLQMKPRRTASGVATITVITKPWPCANACLYCPSDVRMPKSYLSDEPACQRAERNYFDPYLQVATRLQALIDMGHATDKVELIVLGGTWSDYPQEYQLWFASELFRALNEGGTETGRLEAKARRTWYQEHGFSQDAEKIAAATEGEQRRVNAGETTYNQAISRLYGAGSVWDAARKTQAATIDDLTRHHAENETAAHRCVGLVVETRPDAVTAESLVLLRRIGCTKVQMGVQSLDGSVLAANRRADAALPPQSAKHGSVRAAFALARLFGFKIHAHFMANLVGATPESDKADYRRFVTDAAYAPDEVKLYPCVLVESADLRRLHDAGQWGPYDEDTLIDVLAADTLATPAYTRISRMIRDISAHDIVAGSTKTNLRQEVEARIARRGQAIREIRHREISVESACVDDLSLDIIPYDTPVSRERFLQWVTPEGKIAGFLRLSLPNWEEIGHGDGLGSALAQGLPVRPGEAMIREVHVYGAVAQLGSTSSGAQHLGLGRRLVDAACDIARHEGYGRINVISAVGTREYYRKLGFAATDDGLYQQKALRPIPS